MKILNLTQHTATPEQKKAGVVDLQGEKLAALKELLTFERLPTKKEIDARAHDIAQLATFNGLGDDGEDPCFLFALIGGAPYLMGALEGELLDVGVTPLYAFSARESVETEIDGKIVKTSEFTHKGFVAM